MPESRLTVMGSFVADLAFRSPHLPAWGETVMGSEFRLGPGGKGSNQAVAAARLGANVTFISKLGRDPFGELARRTYRDEGIDTGFVFEALDHPTGAATVMVDQATGENAIIVVPGAGFHLTCRDIDQARAAIGRSAVFMTQLEVSLDAVEYGLQVARSLGVPTILNPAPALSLPDRIYPFCDYLTPNESEAAILVGQPVTDLAGAERAAEILLSRGVGNVVVTLGGQGALVKTPLVTRHVPAVDAGPVVETTGAGDAFNGGFAVALAEGLDIVAATRFGCAVAGISVTRHGTALSMPARSEVETLLGKDS
ncbi:MAG TPA: ribokinase [Thermoanaerobaculia bacterium]|jgi:ribokinase|nr:ribokinase [Thermoanaerobaculia bacterium]